MSTAFPSVTTIAPPTRSGGVSASAECSAANNCVPRLSGSPRGESTTLTSTLSSGEPLFEFFARRLGLARPLFVWFNSDWSSTKRDDVFQRPAVFAAPAKDRPARSATTRRRAHRSNAAPGRRHAVSATSASAASASATIAGKGNGGAKAIDQTFNATAFQQVFGVDLIRFVIARHLFITRLTPPRSAISRWRAAGNERIERAALGVGRPRRRRDRSR